MMAQEGQAKSCASFLRQQWVLLLFLERSRQSDIMVVRETRTMA